MKHKLKIILNILICTVVCVAILFGTNVGYRAFAAEIGYARVIGEVILYRQPTTNQNDIFFALPYSYYVKVTDWQSDTHYQVEYQDNTNGYAKVVGYVLKSQLSAIEATANTPFLKTTVKVVTNSVSLRAAPSVDSALLGLAVKDQSLLYYGKLTNSSGVWYCVLFSGEIGYVSSSSVSAPEIPLHPTPMPSPLPSPQPSASPSKPPSDNKTANDIVQIILIAGISVPAFVIVLLLFKQPKPKKPKTNQPSYYEEFDEL